MVNRGLKRLFCPPDLLHAAPFDGFDNAFLYPPEKLIGQLAIDEARVWDRAQIRSRL